MHDEAVRFHTSKGMTFYVRGKGRPIVFLHGWCLNRKMWVYAEEALMSEFQVVTPDLPGFGQSDHLAGPYTLDRYGNEVKTLLEEAKLDGAILVGFAFGAAVAIQCATTFPDNVKGVVAVAVPGASHSPYLRMPKAMRRDWPDFARKSANALFHTPQSEATLHWLEALFAAAPLPVALETVQVLSSYEPVEVVGRVEAPVLFLHADHDGVAPESLGLACAQATPKGRLEVVRDCGHLIVLDQKIAFHEQLKSFLQTI